MTTCIVAPSARTMTLASTRLGSWNMTLRIALSERQRSMTPQIGFGNGHRRTNEEQQKRSCTLKQDLGYELPKH